METDYDSDDEVFEYAVGTWEYANGKLSINIDSEKTQELYPDQFPTGYFPVSFTVAALTSKKMVLSLELLGFVSVTTYERV